MGCIGDSFSWNWDGTGMGVDAVLLEMAPRILGEDPIWQPIVVQPRLGSKLKDALPR
jgi:hypothetical protein